MVYGILIAFDFFVPQIFTVQHIPDFSDFTIPREEVRIVYVSINIVDKMSEWRKKCYAEKSLLATSMASIYDLPQRLYKHAQAWTVRSRSARAATTRTAPPFFNSSFSTRNPEARLKSLLKERKKSSL
jgi:hypothetical protein